MVLEVRCIWLTTVVLADDKNDYETEELSPCVDFYWITAIPLTDSPDPWRLLWGSV